MDDPSQREPTSSRNRRRRRWFRLIALLIGLSPLLIAELTLRTLNWPPPSELDDPLIGFSSHIDLFDRSADGERWETAPARQEFFRPDGFAATKQSNEFRIFCLGGSTVQGRPYQIETSFTTWLELSLQAAAPQVEWRVVNCGGVSYASYRLVPILEEVLQHEPDLVILYTGHNEFLEDRTYADLVAADSWRGKTHRIASQWATYRAVRHGWLRMSGQPHRRPPQQILHHEVQARLDFQNGLDQFVRDDNWTHSVESHYELNLERMIRLAERADVPVLLCNPVSNLRDCRPFKSVHSHGTSNNDVDAVARLHSEASNRLDRTAEEPDEADRLSALRRAVALDPRFALSQYKLGRCLDLHSEPDSARVAYIQAKDEDICKLRMTESMHASVARVARRTGVRLVDVRQLFEQRSPDGIPDETWLLDHVHPTIPGHRQIAQKLLEELQAMGYVRPTSDWESERDRLYRAHTDGLDFAYYEHGRQRLEGLYRWAQGQAYGALPESDKVLPRSSD